MTTLISLLRGINVGGHKKVKMADLKTLYASLDFDNVTTYVQSGNIVFQSDAPLASLPVLINDAIETSFGFSTDILIRTMADWRRLIEENPFSKDSNMDVSKLYATLLTETPSQQAINALSEIKAQPDHYHLNGQTIYLHCLNGYGRTKLSNNFWEKKLKIRATTRNWKTVNRLFAIAESLNQS
jgi:uncharacterized protein (DUF1697 family)